MARAVALAGQDGLSEMQSAYVRAILNNMSEEQALEAGGYSAGNIRGGPGRSDLVKLALKAGREAIIRGELSQSALNAMRDMLKPSTPAATRFGAAKWILEHGDGEQASDDKPIHLMTQAELEGFMARAQAVMNEGGSAPIIDVTPNNGA